MKPLLVGVGNPLRGDDGAGPEIVRRLTASGAEVFETVLVTGDPLELLDLWEGRPLVVIVDSYEDQEHTGQLRHWSLLAGEGEAPFVTGGFSSHMIGLAETIELGKNLERLPGELHLIGIPGNHFVLGEDLGETVQSRMNEAIAQIEELFCKGTHNA